MPNHSELVAQYTREFDDCLRNLGLVIPSDVTSLVNRDCLVDFSRWGVISYGYNGKSISLEFIPSRILVGDTLTQIQLHHLRVGDEIASPDHVLSIGGVILRRLGYPLK